MKRTFDLFGATLAVVLFSPLILIVALRIRRQMGAPILFRQIRPGLGGRPFEMVKFRTMRDAHDAQGNPLSDAERLADFGRYLCSGSLDDLSKPCPRPAFQCTVPCVTV